MLNSTFVGLIVGRDLLRVESDGDAWLQIQDRIRPILNQYWDPIGVADISADEYDHYIGDLYRLLKIGSSASAIAEHLRSIEADQMQMRVSSIEQLHSVAERLRGLDLPDARIVE